MNLTQTLYLFCCVVISLVFIIAVVTKLINFRQLVETIQAFQLVSPFLVLPSAMAILIAETLVVGLMAINQSSAFTLSIFLLSAFTAALTSLLSRRIYVPCNCFGGQQNPVTFLEVLRNLVFLICACCGVWLSTSFSTPTSFSVEKAGGIWFAAIAFTLIWTHIGEVYHAFRLSK